MQMVYELTKMSINAMLCLERLTYLIGVITLYNLFSFSIKNLISVISVAVIWIL